MDCFEIKKKITLWMDDLLEEAESSELSAHLAICRDCAEEKRRLSKLFQFAHAVAVPEPSPEVWLRIREALRRPKTISWGERIQVAIERAREASVHYLPSYALGALSAAAVLLVALPAARVPSAKETKLHPVSPAENVSSRMQPTEEFPMRYVGVEPSSPGKTFRVENGQLWEIENPPARPAVNFPVREMGIPASLASKDF